MDWQVTLAQMLMARERRAFKQQELLSQYHASLICFTMNIAGPVKNSPLIRQGFALGKAALERQLSLGKINCLYRETTEAVTGSEAYYVLDRDADALKEITVAIEDDSPLGRLFDMDVLSPEGIKVERQALGFPVRRCLICQNPAKECARSRTHTVEELQSATWRILSQAVAATVSCHNLEPYPPNEVPKDAASFALRALLYEVCTTPKPGLVDCGDCGSHRDMDIFTFMDSASVLWPYFHSCARIGRETAALPAPHTFSILREEGKKAETDMFAATKGINTHKGAIFSMGILCGALGRLPKKHWKTPAYILDECAAMTKGLTDADFAELKEENACTTGQKLYLRHHITGVRGQMEEGLPAVRNAGLPVLKGGLARGLSLNDAGCAALLALMCAATDTNLIARSDYDTWQETLAHLRKILADNPYPDVRTLQKLNREFVEKNLSPGGSADLLAVCYLLYFLETEIKNV